MSHIEHPPYLPDLNLPDFLLFLRFKLSLNSKRFDDIPDIQRNVIRLLNIPKEDFLQRSPDMYSISQQYIVTEVIISKDTHHLLCRLKIATEGAWDVVERELCHVNQEPKSDLFQMPY
ncbi:hypothetical protein TNCV_3935371 [Trichonephila clavipes]|nr:hypothetical protein TNCV_3935371 [Trichonephila clavipes]